MSPYQENISLLVRLILDQPQAVQEETLQNILLGLMRLYEDSETRAVANAMIEKKYIADLRQIA